jgi:hypothetical protein
MEDFGAGIAAGAHSTHPHVRERDNARRPQCQEVDPGMKVGYGYAGA